MNAELFKEFIETIVRLNIPFALLGMLILTGSIIVSKKVKSFIHQIRRG